MFQDVEGCFLICVAVDVIEAHAMTGQVLKGGLAKMVRENVALRLARGYVAAAQWRLLKAIAKEGSVQHPTASSFIQKCRLGSGAAVSKNVRSLVEKELILVDNDGGGERYCVYNVFLSRFLEKD